METNRRVFLQFSAEVTGYASSELEGTGLVDQYFVLVGQVVGLALGDSLYELCAQVLQITDAGERHKAIATQFLPSPIWGPVLNNVITLWYLGVWNQLPDTFYQAASLPKPGPTDAGRPHVPSALAYVEQLSYRNAGAHTPGAKPTGFGSWSIAPQTTDLIS